MFCINLLELIKDFLVSPVQVNILVAFVHQLLVAVFLCKVLGSHMKEFSRPAGPITSRTDYFH